MKPNYTEPETSTEDLQEDFSPEHDFLHSKTSTVYIKKAHTLEDVRSSAYTFTFMGIIGLLAVFCIFNGIIPIPMVSYMKWIFTTVMSILFLFFFITGIHSFMQIKGLKSACITEANLSQEIKDWFLAAYTARQVDEMAGVDLAVLGEEQIYFPRYEQLKSLITEEFTLTDAFLEEMAEELYPLVFVEK